MPKFRRRIGAAADVKELEYVSALHQTCMPNLRENATVSSLDIARFLKSRTNINVTHQDGIRIVRGLGGGVIGEDVIQKILEQVSEPADLEKKAKKQIEEQMRMNNSLGSLRKRLKKDKENKEEEDAQDDENPPDEVQEAKEEYLDLVQITAILLMPTLARAAKESSMEETQHELSPKNNRILLEGSHGPLDPEPSNIIPHVLSTLLEMESHDREYPTLNAELVKKILVEHGEYERAADAVLVDKMVQAASSSTGLFDLEAFTNALTSDLSAWKVGCEDDLTTSFYDVFGFETYREKRKVEKEGASARGSIKLEDVNEEVEVGIANSTTIPGPMTTSGLSKTSQSDGDDGEYKLDRPRTYIDIDYVTDTHSSLTLTVVTFLFFICTSLVYAVLFQQLPAFQPSCTDTFGCQLGNKIITWLVFAIMLALVGYFVIIPLSIGNNPAEVSPTRNFLAFLIALVITWIPFAAVNAYERSIDGPPYETVPEETVSRADYDGAQWVTRTVGCLVAALMLVQCLLSFVADRRSLRESHPFLCTLLTTSAVCGTARSKRAATRKINGMMTNAYKLRPAETDLFNGTTIKEGIMINYVLKGEDHEYCGGLLWTWKQVLSGRLFDVEGVWISTRLIIIQTMQLIFIAFWIYTLVLFIDEAVKASAQAQEDLVPGIYPQWVYDIVPTPEQTRKALYPALGVAIVDMVLIFLIYVPSYVGRVVQYRSGDIASLRSADFVPFRIAVDAVFTNIGNAIFALVGSSVLFFSIIGLLIFLFIWDFSRDFMILLLAWFLGLMFTIALKIIVVSKCRKKFYAGFYRTNPMAANLTVLGLECWFIGLGGGVLVGRFVQFLLAACYFVGRTDVPFLSKHVSLFGYAFDFVPRNFVKDILVHEAHRHPYMERLLAMYLCKLKTRSFGSEAGACWRQLFVVSLMPWLLRARVFSDERLDVDLMDEYNAKRLERKSLIMKDDENEIILETRGESGCRGERMLGQS